MSSLKITPESNNFTKALVFTRSNLVINRITYISLVTARTRVRSTAKTNKALDKTEREIKNGNRTV